MSKKNNDPHSGAQTIPLPNRQDPRNGTSISGCGGGKFQLSRRFLLGGNKEDGDGEGKVGIRRAVDDGSGGIEEGRKE